MTSKKLKKRNSSFIDIYKRISDELKSRNETASNSSKSIIDEDKADEVNSTQASGQTESFKTISYFSGIDEPCGSSENYFLKRKISSSVALEVEIPSFLHDKKNRNVGAEKKSSKEKEKEEVKECISGK